MWPVPRVEVGTLAFFALDYYERVRLERLHKHRVNREPPAPRTSHTTGATHNTFVFTL